MGDFSLTTFTSSGKLNQIEYAQKAVDNGDTALGIKAKDGVVIAVEKKLSSILVDENSYQKIQNLGEHVGVTYSGLGPDFRVLNQKARKTVQQYWLQYRENIFVTSLCRQTASTVQEYTQSGGVRPFGVSLLVAGYDSDGPHLYQVDPSGAYYGWKATAIGKNMKNAKTFLEKRYSPEMGIEDAIHTALLTLKEGYQGSMNASNIEVGVVKSDGKFKVLSVEQIKDYLEEVE
ncbi:proteasome subunit alpha type 2, putative [Ichthyophthirius multifiliis]|uniref:Proteasome subunit alpha type 2, putative n=1 Tax=Ichthyophthirius multifiliis TaxID=5932 RepID=G0QLS3_ICHMU|nr:proteasome subunit alpha type 2, putative [Ichthyophthirius multifiliis]EGR33832.1 proteasome subunit alpha type 2, putative [Ichthyophthirius multifiliis]|eukprot:XP_004039056.1 proteasome subunit alpha type 2, putative [Ichthyophthirius multifiliis]